MKRLIYLFSMFCLSCFFLACGGGGGGGAGEDEVIRSTSLWRAEAEVTSDNCGERISAVTQKFRVSRNGDSVSVETGILTLTSTIFEAAFTISFQETNGSCTRTYQASFSEITDTTANVDFSSISVCGGSICQSTWSGTASKIEEVVKESAE